MTKYLVCWPHDKTTVGKLQQFTTQDEYRSSVSHRVTWYMETVEQLCLSDGPVHSVCFKERDRQWKQFRGYSDEETRSWFETVTRVWESCKRAQGETSGIDWKQDIAYFREHEEGKGSFNIYSTVL